MPVIEYDRVSDEEYKASLGIFADGLADFVVDDVTLEDPKEPTTKYTSIVKLVLKITDIEGKKGTLWHYFYLGGTSVYAKKLFQDFLISIGLELTGAIDTNLFYKKKGVCLLKVQTYKEQERSKVIDWYAPEGFNNLEKLAYHQSKKTDGKIEFKEDEKITF